MTRQPTHDHSVTDRSLLSTKAYGTGQHLAARQSLYRWQTPRHDLPGIVVNELAGVRGAVADMGCGNGKFVARMREDRPDPTVLAMDVSHGILGAIPGAVVADVQQLPIADGSLGAVLALHMLYHVEEQVQAVREMGRVLAPGGIAIVSTNSRTDKRELEHLWRQASGDVLGMRMTQETDCSISPAKTMTWSMRLRRRWTTSVPARLGPPSGVVKTHWYRAHSSGMSTAEQRTIVPVPAGCRRMSSTNRSTASIPSLRPNGPQKTTSEVRAWESSAVT